MNSDLQSHPEVKRVPVIVVGVDGSETADAALQWAIARAKASQMRLHIVSVYTLPSFTVAPLESGYIPSEGVTVEESTEKIVNEAEQKAKDAGVLVSSAVESGDRAGILVELSKQADLMVIGTSSSGLAGRFLGSVSLNLPAHSHCPVVVVPIAAEGHHWTPVKSIVVGSDGSRPSKGALGYALAEAAAWDAKLTAVSAFHPVGNAAWVPVIGNKDEALEDVRAGLRATLGSSLKSYQEQTNVSDAQLKELEKNISLHTIEGDAAQLLSEFSTATDLVVVGSRGRGGFTGRLLGSTSQKVLHYADCPVMVVPSRAYDDRQISPIDVPWRRSL